MSILVRSEVGADCLSLLQRAVGKSRRRISYMDNEFNIADNETDYTGRIGVSKTEHGVLLTISDVQLSDNREFFCSVNGLAAGSAEGKTNLSVFGKNFHQDYQCGLLPLSSSCVFVMYNLSMQLLQSLQ